MDPRVPLSPPAPTAPACRLAVCSAVLGGLGLGCLSILGGIPAVICGHLALAQIRRAGGELGGRGLALAGLALGYAAIALFMVLVPVLLALLLPAVASARGAASGKACESNIRQLGIACLTYAGDNDGHAPATWTAVDSYLGGPAEAARILHCPGDRKGTGPSYQIVFAGRISELTAPDRVALVQEDAARHRGRRTVVYADGHADEVPDGPRR